MRSLSNLRQNFIAYHSDPTAFIDMSTLEQYCDNEFRVFGRTLEDVCDLERLGSGAYSVVYGIDEKRALKVVREDDPGYARYINSVARKMSGNPYIPRVYYSGVWGKKQVYILERLSAGGINRDEIFPFYPDMSWGERKAFEDEYRWELGQILKTRKDANNIKEAFIEAIRNLMRGRASANPFMKYDEKLVELCELLKQTQSANDLHDGNVMFRGATPVLTDPAAD